MFRGLTTEERYQEWKAAMERSGLASTFELPPSLPALPPLRREELPAEPYRTPVAASLVPPVSGPCRSQQYLCAAIGVLAVGLVVFLAFCALAVGWEVRP